MELQVGVKVLLKGKNGKYLLVRRSPLKYPEVGPKWDIVGGRIDPGTPLFKNLKREVKEETSLNLVKQPKIVAAQDILRVPGRHVVRLTYAGEITGEPKLDGDHTEYKWFTKAEMKKMTKKVIDIYLKELLNNGTV